MKSSKAKLMSNVLTPSERVARIISTLDPYGIWYFLNIENEEGGDTRIRIHLQYCVVHPDDINIENDEDSRKYIHDMYVDWLNYSDETFVCKLEDVKIYLHCCNVLKQQKNYPNMALFKKAEFVEAELVKFHKEKENGEWLPL